MPRVPTGESSVARSVRILECFTPTRRTLRVGDIASLADLPVPTTSRLVRELTRLGFLERTSDGRVQVGLRFWELASRASPTSKLRSLAMPHLEQLHATVGHHVQLVVLDTDEVLCIERLSARGSVINYSQVASRLPVHAIAPGLVFMAYDEALLQRVSARSLPSFTTRTPSDPDRLAEAVAAARRHGVAVVRGTVVPGVGGVSAAIRNGLREVVAAVSVVAPDDDALDACVPATLAAARAISRDFLL